MKFDKYISYNRALTSEEVSLLYSKQLYIEPPKYVKGIDSFFSDRQAYIDLGTIPDYKIDNFEIELYGYFANGIRQDVATLWNFSGDFAGWRIRRDSVNNWLSFTSYQNSGSSFAVNFNPVVDDTENGVKLNIKHINGVSAEMYVNNEEVSFINGQPLTVFDSADKLIIFSGTDSGFNETDGNITVFKLYELDTQGSRIKELINLDFSQQSGTAVPNIATDAPLNSDGVVIPNGQAADSWWQKYGAYETVLALDAKQGIIQDRQGNAFTNNGVKVVRDGAMFPVMRNNLQDEEINFGNTTFNLGLNSITLSAWFKINSIPTVNHTCQVLGNADGSNNDGCYSLYINNAQNIMLFVDFGANTVSVSAPLEKDKWYHVVGVVDRIGNLSLYLNGQFTGASAISAYVTTDLQSTNDFRMFQYNGTDNGLLSVGEVRKFIGIPSDSSTFSQQYYNSTKKNYLNE